MPPILVGFRRRHGIGQPILISAKVGTVCHCINDNSVTRFQAQIFENFCNFLMLPGLGDQPLAVRSTTSDPFSEAAFAIFPRFDPPIKTVLPLLCMVGRVATLRKKEAGGLSSPTQNFSFNSVKTAQITVFSSFSVRGGMAAGMGLSKAPDTKFLILGFLVPAGSERGAEDVYTLLPPVPGPEPASRTSPKVGQTAVVPGSSGEDPTVKIYHVPHQCFRPNPAYGDWDVGHDTDARAHLTRYPG
jgi:hypothetical protein